MLFRKLTFAFALGALLLLLMPAPQAAPAGAVFGVGLRELPIQRLFVITVGINRYAHKGVPEQKNAVADATELASTLARAAKGAFDETPPTITLTEKQATKQNIEAAFARVAALAGPNDAFVFHFAGVGGGVGKDGGFYLLTSDATAADLQEKAINPETLSVWCSKIQARRVLILLDTDDVGNEFDRLAESVIGENKQVARLVGKSVTVLGPNGRTYDATEFGHGEFTNVVLTGLGGAADLTGDGRITVRELTSYMYGRLPKQRIEAQAAARRRQRALLRDEMRSEQDPAKKEELIAGLARLEKETPYEGDLITPKSVVTGKDWVLTAKPKPKPEGGAAATAPSRDAGSDGDQSGIPSLESPGKRYALLFATDTYDGKGYSNLSNPIFDAEAIAKDLREIYGYEARVVRNPTLEDIAGALSDYMARKYGPHDQLFVFFAGHGTFLERYKEGFVIASDSEKGKEMQTALSFSNLHSLVDRIECNHIMLVLDTCFGGTFFENIANNFNRSNRDGAGAEKLTRGQRIARRLQYRSRKLLASGAGPVSDGIAGRHSPFAFYVLDALRSGADADGLLTFGKLLEYVADVKPGTIDANFGSFQPGSDFIFVAQRP